MKFSYTALTNKNKKITGVLDADNESSAQAELHKMGVAILSVNEISDEEYKKFQSEKQDVQEEKGISTFVFLATDDSGQEMEGTIDAKDDYSAYKRLINEYHFVVNELYLDGASEIEKENAKMLLGSFQLRVEDENANSKLKKDNDNDDNLLDSSENVNKDLIEEIDKVILNTKKILENYKDIYTIDLFREIENKLAELELIRTSNNIRHITEVSNDLHTLISNPDNLADDSNEEFSEHRKFLDEIEDSALVKKDDDIYKRMMESSALKKTVGNLKSVFENIVKVKENEDKNPNFFTKIKKKINEKLKESKQKKRIKERQEKANKKQSKFKHLVLSILSYFTANDSIIRKAKFNQLKKEFKNLFKSSAKKSKEIESPNTVENNLDKKEKKKSKIFIFFELISEKVNIFFIELDSFFAWLLSFYIIYFLLVDISLDKKIFLNSDFVFKTLNSPLLFNISVFLLLFHFIFRFANLHFSKNIFARFFSILFVTVIYLFFIINF